MAKGTEIEDKGRPMNSCIKYRDYVENKYFIKLSNGFFTYNLEVTKTIFDNF